MPSETDERPNERTNERTNCHRALSKLTYNKTKYVITTMTAVCFDITHLYIVAVDVTVTAVARKTNTCAYSTSTSVCVCVFVFDVCVHYYTLPRRS